MHLRFEASLDEARAFVRVLCMGMGTFDCSSRVVQPQAQGNVGNAMTPVLVVKNCKLFGDFATRSRIPFNVVSDPAGSMVVQGVADCARAWYAQCICSTNQLSQSDI